MTNSNRGRITYTVCEIIIAQAMEVENFAYPTLILDPRRGTTTISNPCNLYFAEKFFQSPKYGCTFIRLAVAATKISLRNHVKFEVIAVQGHPRSSTLMPIERHTISYYSLIVTLDLSCTVFQILTHKSRNSLYFPPHSCLTPRSSGTSQNFWLKLIPQKLQGY